MPLYDLQCPLCNAIWETLSRYNEDVRCAKCGCLATRLISAPQFKNEIAPYYDNGLGVLVESRDHRKRVMKSRSLDESGKTVPTEKRGVIYSFPR